MNPFDRGLGKKRFAGAADCNMSLVWERKPGLSHSGPGAPFWFPKGDSKGCLSGSSGSFILP